MLSNKIYKTIKEGILSGTYKRLRLVRINDNSQKDFLTNFNSFINGGQENAIKRLDYIKFQLDKFLPSGNYIIEVSTIAKGTGIVDTFNVKKNPITISVSESGENAESLQDFTKEQESMSEIDIEEYKELLKQISNQQSIIEVQKMKIEFLESELRKTPLSEPASTGNVIMKVLEDHLPTALGIFDKFLTQRDKQFELQDREISLKENGYSPSNKKKVVSKKREKTKEEILSEMTLLYDKNEDDFNKTLSEIEIKNPELHAFICDQMFEEGEEEEE